MFNKGQFFILLLSLLFFASCAYCTTPQHQGMHFKKIMIVFFENMSYEDIKNEPTFKKLVEYTGHELSPTGLKPLKHTALTIDSNNNHYAIFTQYYNNHRGGTHYLHPSQPNYIAMVSGSTYGIKDDENHDLNGDNLALELMDAKLSWKVYAEDLPDPKEVGVYESHEPLSEEFYSHISPYTPNPALNEDENAKKAHAYYLDKRQSIKISKEITSACYLGKQRGKDGYVRKHEPLISFMNIQSNPEFCKKIVNAKHFGSDIVNQSLPEVALYIPNLKNDGHNGNLDQRTFNANRFLSKMMGANPATGEPEVNSSEAPFQKFLAQDGLLVITFDEPSVKSSPSQSIYTLLIGNMIKSGAYPNTEDNNKPICYPSVSQQTSQPQDKYGYYEQYRCNHYNLLKLIEANWHLRGLASKNTASGYKFAYPLDNGLKEFWRV